MKKKIILILIIVVILAAIILAAFLISRNVGKDNEETPWSDLLADFIFNPIPPETFGDNDPPEDFWIKLAHSSNLPMDRLNTYTLFDTENDILGKFMYGYENSYGNTGYIETGFNIDEAGKRLLYNALLYYNIKEMQIDTEHKSETSGREPNYHRRLTFNINGQMYNVSYDGSIEHAITEEKIKGLAYFNKVMMDYVFTTPEYNDPLAYLPPDTSGLPDGFYVKLEFSSEPDFPVTNTYTYIDSAKNRVGEPYFSTNKHGQSYHVYQYYRYTYYYPKTFLKEIYDVIIKHGLSEFNGGIYTEENDWEGNEENGLTAYHRLSFSIGGEEYSIIYDNTFMAYNSYRNGTGESISEAHSAIMGFYSTVMIEKNRLGFDYNVPLPADPPEDFWIKLSTQYRGVENYVLLDTKEAVLGRTGMSSYDVISQYDSETLSPESIDELLNEAYNKIREFDIESFDGLEFKRLGEHYPAIPKFMFILEFGYIGKNYSTSFERDIDGHYHGDGVKDLWEFFAHLMWLAAMTPEYSNMPRLDNMWSTPP